MIVGPEPMYEKTIIAELPPQERCQVTFRKLTYSVKVKAQRTRGQPPPPKKMIEKVILNNVTGTFKPGRMTALMGASGAGKTTLLQVLAGGVTMGEIYGEILLNGVPVEQKTIRDIAGFVFQDDIILGTMTVREAITMSATLRLGKNNKREFIEKKVNEMIKIFNLDRCQNTFIGTESIKGVSGGERKRCAMAMEIVTNPCILFLDEPTSGLDSFTAFSVISTLKELATSGRTIIATIHQPSAEVFNLFDDLLLLADGKIIYQGPVSESVSYFARFGYQCPKFTNPSDYFFMRILNNEEGKHFIENDDNRERIKKMIVNWTETNECSAILQETNSVVKGTIVETSYKKQSTFVNQFEYLFARASKNSLRNPLIIRAKLGQTLFISLLLGLIYLNLNQRTGVPALQDRMGVLFFLSMFQIFIGTIGNLSVFALEKPVFMREHGAGYYTLPSYFISKLAIELPFNFIFPTIMSIIVYWMAGLYPSASNFFILVGLLILDSICGLSLGIFIASWFDSLNVALIAAPLIILPLMLFSGLFATENAIPAYFHWIQYISPIKYSFEGMAKNELQDRDYIYGLGFSGNAGLEQYGIGKDDNLTLAICAAILAAMVVILVTGAYLCLRRIVVNQSRTVPVLPHPENSK